MITRYTRPTMGRIWEDQNKYQRWLDVEPFDEGLYAERNSPTPNDTTGADASASTAAPK